MGVNVRQNIVTNGLVLYLDAGSRKSYPGSGSLAWTNLSGNGYNGTLKVSGSGAVSASFNSANQGSIQFSGTGSFVSIPYTIQSLFTNQITINVWINAQQFDTVINDGVCIIGKNYPSVTPPYSIWGLVIGPSGAYTGTVGDGVTRLLVTSALTLSLNTWHNLSFTYDGTMLKLYRNGVQDATTGTATYTLGQNNIDVGIGNNIALYPYNDWFKGQIPMVQLYNRALSAQEITQNYNAVKTRFELT